MVQATYVLGVHIPMCFHLRRAAIAVMPCGRRSTHAHVKCMYALVYSRHWEEPPTRDPDAEKSFVKLQEYEAIIEELSL